MFPGRTGSTFLTDHMKSHPEICARFEILSRHPDSWESQLECMTTLFQTKRYPHIKALGFKCKLTGVLDQDAFGQFLRDWNFRIIHLVRENHLKFIVSVIRSRHLRSEQGRSNLLEKGQDPIGPITIPEPVFARAKKRLNVASRLQDFVEASGLSTLRIAYEDLISDESRVLAGVWEFLEVQPHETVSTPRKNTPDDIRKAVLNLDELIAHHPEMARFLDSDK